MTQKTKTKLVIVLHLGTETSCNYRIAGRRLEGGHGPCEIDLTLSSAH